MVGFACTYAKNDLRPFPCPHPRGGKRVRRCVRRNRLAVCRDSDIWQYASRHAVSAEAKITFLHAAAALGHTERVAFLSDSGAFLEAAFLQTHCLGDTPLVSAICAGQLETAALLLTRGANVEVAARGGLTPICLASMAGWVDALRLLLKFGADVNPDVEEGPLVLLCRWASRNCRTINTVTGSSAPMCDFVACADLLLKSGADLEAEDNHGFPPYMWICSNRRSLTTDESGTLPSGALAELRALLVSRGAVGAMGSGLDSRIASGAYNYL